jgi:hypothetical protein
VSRCKDCQHWEWPNKPNGAPYLFRACLRQRLGTSLMAADGDVMTSPNFGCVMFEPPVSEPESGEQSK